MAGSAGVASAKRSRDASSCRCCEAFRLEMLHRIPRSGRSTWPASPRTPAPRVAIDHHHALPTLRAAPAACDRRDRCSTPACSFLPLERCPPGSPGHRSSRRRRAVAACARRKMPLPLVTCIAHSRKRERRARRVAHVGDHAGAAATRAGRSIGRSRAGLSRGVARHGNADCLPPGASHSMRIRGSAAACSTSTRVLTITYAAPSRSVTPAIAGKSACEIDWNM